MSDQPPPPPGGSPPPPPPPGGSPPPPPPGGNPPFGSYPPPGGGYGPPGGGYGPPGGGYPPPGGGGYGPPGGGYGGGPRPYRVGDAFGYAFKKFQENVLPLVLITLVLLVGAALVQVLGNLITTAVTPGRTLNFETGQYEGGGGGLFGIAMLLSFLFGVLSFVVNLVVQSAIIKAALALTRGQKPDLGSALTGINWLQVILAALLIGVLTLVGLLLCILPGIAVAFFSSYALYFVIDRDQDAITAIKSSFTMVANNFGPLVLFFLASIAAVIAGLCACGVGLLVAIPVVVIAQAYTFRTLTNDPVTA